MQQVGDRAPVVKQAIERRLEQRLCGTGLREKGYRHAAFIFSASGAVKEVLSYGMNIYPFGRSPIHAEEYAINKLRRRDNNKLLKPVNICILRVSATGRLGESRPCLHCIRMMAQRAPCFGYRINWVYFSTSAGEIDRRKLSHLLRCKDVHVSAYFRRAR